MRILLLRHGQSEANVNGRIQGPTDPLTDHGRQQARLLGQHLQATYRLDLLLSSNLNRATETAEIVAGFTGNQVEQDPRWREIDNGISVGQLWTDWRANNPDLAAVWGWDVRHADAAWEGGESGRDVCRRAFAAMNDLISAHQESDRTIGVITHGGVIAWLAAWLNGDSLETWPAPYGDIANCSVTEIEIAEPGVPRIARWNLTAHLGDTFAPHISPVIPIRKTSG